MSFGNRPGAPNSEGTLVRFETLRSERAGGWSVEGSGCFPGQIVRTNPCSRACLKVLRTYGPVSLQFYEIDSRAVLLYCSWLSIRPFYLKGFILSSKPYKLFGSLDLRFEGAIRAHFLPADRETAFMTLLVASVASLLFLGFDYLYFGVSPELVLFGTMRVMFVGYTLYTARYVRHRAPIERFDGVLLRWSIALCLTMMLFPVLSRFEEFASNLIIHSTVLLCAYVVIPIKPLCRFFAAAPLYLFDLFVIVSGMAGFPRLEAVANVLSLTTVSLIGIMTTVSIFNSRRREFHALEHERAEREKFETLAMIDPLTEVYNRRSFMLLLEQEFARYLREGQSFSIMIMDIDEFKAINDQFSHGGGDAVLRAFCDHLACKKRSSDSLGRLGGDEFALLLPHTAGRAALEAAERFTAASHEIQARFGDQTIPFTFSGGITTVLPADHTVDQIIHRADMILYEAKKNGRNSVSSG